MSLTIHEPPSRTDKRLRSKVRGDGLVGGNVYRRRDKWRTYEPSTPTRDTTPGVSTVGGVSLQSAQFRALWVAELTSVLGDQLAKVVIALLVYAHTGSAAASGVAYGLTFLPPLVTVRLSGLADRYPRRDMLVVCYVGQACVVAVMAIPGMPVPVLVVAAMVVAGVQSLGKAAQGALITNLVGAEQNTSARAKLLMYREIGQLGGLVGAAAVVVVIGTTPALVLDVLSFAAAAGLVGFLVPRAPKPVPSGNPGQRPGLRAVITDARNDRVLRTLWMVLALIGLTVALRAVVVPYVDSIGAPTWCIGILFAADSAGYVAGSWWVGRLGKQAGQRRQTQQRLLLPLAMASLAPLVIFAMPLPWWTAAILLAVSGAGQAYLPIALGEITARTPDGHQGLVNGVQNMVVRVSQGIAAIIVGLLAQVLTAAMAVALAGLCGVVAVAALTPPARGTSFSPRQTRGEVGIS
ncbi:MFS transporter [Labedaea rhizosphaerae]|uniref:MFS transporter n=1 Tax=Labedaea rhizosphaerae TaxID=598644 RepID=UPI00313307D4